jgi:hypothetical protein
MFFSSLPVHHYGKICFVIVWIVLKKYLRKMTSDKKFSILIRINSVEKYQLLHLCFDIIFERMRFFELSNQWFGLTVVFILDFVRFCGNLPTDYQKELSVGISVGCYFEKTDEAGSGTLTCFFKKRGS